MIMKKPEQVTITSDWEKDGKICHITSLKEVIPWADGHEKPEKYGKFSFTGYNPFPCREMRSTFVLIEKWMRENGWKRTHRVTKWISGYDVDDRTGEYINRYDEIYHYIPVVK